MSCVYAGISFLKLVNDRLNRSRADGLVTGYLHCTISILEYYTIVGLVSKDISQNTQPHNL